MTSLQISFDSALLTSSPGPQKDWIVSSQRFDSLSDAQEYATKLASSNLQDCPIYEKISVAQAPVLPAIKIVDVDQPVLTPTPVTLNAISS